MESTPGRGATRIRARYRVSLVLIMPYQRFSVHTGPKGGVEFRGWTGADTFRVVAKYVAWSHLSPDDKSKAETMAASRNAAKDAKEQSDAMWRSLVYRR